MHECVRLEQSSQNANHAGPHVDPRDSCPCHSRANRPRAQTRHTCARSDLLNTAIQAAIGHVQELRGALLGGLAPTIVACGGLDLGMAGELLDSTEIGARVQQIADEGSPQVVRGNAATLAWRVRRRAMYSMACPDIPLS